MYTIGIISEDEYRERVLEIAKGNIKPKEGEPKIWFSSVESLKKAIDESGDNFIEKYFNNK